MTIKLRKVRLESFSGELVLERDMPTLDPKPAAIVWGVRVFAWTGGDAYTYREVFAYWLPEGR